MSFTGECDMGIFNKNLIPCQCEGTEDLAILTEDLKFYNRVICRGEQGHCNAGCCDGKRHSRQFIEMVA